MASGDIFCCLLVILHQKREKRVMDQVMMTSSIWKQWQQNTHSVLFYKYCDLLLWNFVFWDLSCCWWLIIINSFQKSKNVYRLSDDDVIIVPYMLHRDIQSESQSLSLWNLVFGDNFCWWFPHYIKKEKTSYRLSDDDLINMQTSLKIHIQLQPTSVMACHSKTLVLWALSYWWWLKIVHWYRKK